MKVKQNGPRRGEPFAPLPPPFTPLLAQSSRFRDRKIDSYLSHAPHGNTPRLPAALARCRDWSGSPDGLTVLHGCFLEPLCRLQGLS